MKKMRPTPAAFSDVAAIVKANLSGWYMLLALLLLSLIMSGCDTAKEQEAIEESLLLTACTVEVTAEGYTCALSAIDKTMLKLNDGTYLHPWVNATAAKQLTPGQKYLIGFVEVEKDNRFDGIPQCRAYVPVGKAVKITCVQPLDTNPN